MTWFRTSPHVQLNLLEKRWSGSVKIIDRERKHGLVVAHKGTAAGV